MLRPQVSLIITSMLAASLILSTASFAKTHPHKTYKENYKENYKDQSPCPIGLVLKDGLYLGAAAGYDAYRVVDDASFTESGVSFSIDPRLSVNGAVGGGFIGFGHYFENFYNAYLGVELFGNGSAASTDYEIDVSNSIAPFLAAHIEAEVEVDSNYGIGVLPGIKLSKGTLFYVRLGYNWTNIDVTEKVFADHSLVAVSNEEVTSGGFIYGLGMEAAFYGNWSARAEYSHTDYSDFDTDIESEIHPADNQFMLGLIYHFD